MAVFLSHAENSKSAIAPVRDYRQKHLVLLEFHPHLLDFN